MNALEVMEARKSVTSYKTTPVEKEKLEIILKAGMNAAYTGEYTLHCITRKEMIQEIQDDCVALMAKSSNPSWQERAAIPGFAPLHNAPAVVAVIMNKTDNPVVAEMNHETIGCVAQNMMNAATELGLGSCFTFLSTLSMLTPGLKEKIGSDQQHSVGCMVTIGYTDDTAAHEARDYNKVVWVD